MKSKNTFQPLHLLPLLLIITIFNIHIIQRTEAITIPAFSLLRPSKIKTPIPISEELGTFGFNSQFFDPLQIANEDNFPSLREAELKHGRVAMLAVLGNTLPEYFRDQLVPPRTVLLSISKGISFQDVPGGLKALSIVPLFGWVQIFIFVGILETIVLVQRSRRDMPGDYGIGYFGLRDKGRHERSLRSELENGRLAMVAFVAQILIELISGQTPIQQLQSMFTVN